MAFFGTDDDLQGTSEDLTGGDLYNEDIAPTDVEKRTWNRWNIAALWVGMSVCIPTYMLAASLVSGGMNWWQAVLTIFLANMIVLIPMVLNGHAGTKFGIPFPVFARSVFGLYGSNIPALMRAIVACGWFGIQTWIGGAAIYSLFGIISPGLIESLDGILPDLNESFLGLTFGQLIAFLVFWVINMVFVWIGTESIRWLETLAAPFLIIVGLGMLVWAYNAAGGFGPIFSQPSSFDSTSEFLAFFFPSLTGMVGFWATLSLNISDFTRYAKNQKEQLIGQSIGLPPTMTLFSFIGVAVTSATIVIYGNEIWDPVELLKRFESKPVVIFSLFALAVATVSTNIAANIVSPANDLANLAPRLISFKVGGTIAGIIGILIMPWKLLANPEIYIYTWLIGYSALLGPVAGIMICDYFVIRKRNIQIENLYSTDKKEPLFDMWSLIALAAGIFINVPGFIQTATNGNIEVPGIFNIIYTYAWFTGFLFAFGVYFVLKTTVGKQKQ